MKPLLAAAVLALAAPGAAAGGGLSLTSRDLAPARSGAVLRVARFDLVGLHWRGSGALRFRTRTLSGRWSAWQAGAPEGDDLPDRGTEGWSARGWRIGNPFWTGGADAIQYRTAGRVSRVRAFFVRSPTAALRGRRPELAGRPGILTRSEWGANEAIVRAAPRYADSVHLAIVHHTAGSNSYTPAQSASIVRAIEVYHVQGNGWNDIGYNFLVDRYGQIFEGRAGGMTRAVIGAHAEGFNVGSVGVAVIGNYNAATVTPAARAALVSLLAWRLDLDHVDPLSSVVRISTGNPRYAAGKAVTLRAISGHRDTGPTDCPGTSLYAQLPAIRAAVAETGLPKLYSPTIAGTLGGPVRFTARLSGPAPWAVTVRDATGAVVAGGSGSGTLVDWTWDATGAPPGQYAWTITAPQLRPASGTIGAAAPLALQRLKVAPALVTPNGDGRGDDANVTYRLSVPALVTATVLDGSGAVVATLFKQQRRAGTSVFVWTDVGLPDGHYSLVVTASSLGKQVQATVPLSIDRTLAAFAATPVAISPNGDGRLDSLVFSFRLQAPAQVQLRIVSGVTTVVTPLDLALGVGAQQQPWDGGGLPDGRYSAVLSATDSLLTVRQSLVVTLDRKAPTLRLVSFRLLKFWLSEPAQVTVVLNGRAYRLVRRTAGFFRVGHLGRIRSLRAFALDRAGNQSRAVSAHAS